MKDLVDALDAMARGEDLELLHEEADLYPTERGRSWRTVSRTAHADIDFARANGAPHGDHQSVKAAHAAARVRAGRGA